MDKGADRADVTGKLFRKGERLAGEPRQTLAQGVVEALDVQDRFGSFFAKPYDVPGEVADKVRNEGGRANDARCYRSEKRRNYSGKSAPGVVEKTRVRWILS